MSRPLLVLVHGASHDARCWEPTVDALRRQAPDLDVLAVDLPGRGRTPGDLATLTVAECVDAVVAQVEERGPRDVVVVGHSMAGLTVPGVVARLGAERVRRLVLVAACVPPQGGTVLDTLSGAVRLFAARASKKGTPSKPMPGPLARWAFCNGMSKEEKAFTLDRLVDDATRLSAETVDRGDLPQQVPRTWVLTLQDRALRPDKQRRFIRDLGGVEEVVEIDACHDVMISHPDELAGVLAARCV